MSKAAPEASPPADLADRLLLRPTEVARLLGVGRTKVYELMGRGDLPSVRVDGCRRVPAEAARRYVAELLRDQAPGRPA